ncbi:outer membrane protein assembly factor BamA [Candidatus Schneideria nysicola]|uniref:outer membrane protein assembly factor BamA n=1 Tax=Candidatus Schneideria nysicola TaxID=1081631 RepID=UPI001CAA7A8F|nr:outer membrane protein assembly factor BamA [Candidatus Schneideria nysicola]UAJ65510.1 outer membrane protein assembly factor BamA [Candidatus Schneideria nysicola]
MFVNNIFIEGLQRLSITTIKMYLPVIRIGSTISKKDIRNIICTLFATGNFEDIKVIHDNDILLIQVQEFPLIGSICYVGNKIIKNEILQKNLDNIGIQVGEILNPSTLFHLQKDLEQFYHSIGKYSAKIETIIEPLAYNRVAIKFVFNEGISAIVKQLNIIGNEKFSSYNLLSHLQISKNTPWWKENRRFCLKKLDMDIDALRNFYLDRGYVRFDIDSTQISMTPDKKNIYITLNITEGLQYTLSKVTVKSNTIFENSSKIEQLVQSRLCLGTIYHSAEIKKISTEIQNLLINDGYLDAHILNQMEIDDVNQTIELCFYIDIGNRYYVRYIHFEGNHLTKDSVLRREIRQMEGSWIIHSLLNESKNRLEKLGYFETVTLIIQKLLHCNNYVDVFFKVKERNTGNINFGIGSGTDSLLSFQFYMNQDNWLGTGNIVGFSGVKNDYQTNIKVSFTDPYFTLDGINAGGKIFYDDFNGDNTTDFSNFNLKSFGLGTFWGFPLQKKYLFQIGLDYVHDHLYNIKPHLIISRYLKKHNEKKSHTNFSNNDFLLSVDCNVNTLNKVYFPTIGYSATLSNKIGLPGSDNEYYKMNCDFIHYSPINKKGSWIFVTRTQLGYAHGIRKKTVPFYDHFYAGGINTLRGFHANSVGPKAIYYRYPTSEVKNYSTYPIEHSAVAIGGNATVLFTMEVICPLSFFLQERYLDSLRAAIFIDSGTVWDTYWDNNDVILRASNIPNYGRIGDIRISSGISLHWNSPIGPIVLSYARPIKTYIGDRFERFQFNIGKIW